MIPVQSDGTLECKTYKSLDDCSENEARILCLVNVLQKWSRSTLSTYLAFKIEAIFYSIVVTIDVQCYSVNCSGVFLNKKYILKLNGAIIS